MNHHIIHVLQVSLILNKTHWKIVFIGVAEPSNRGNVNSNTRIPTSKRPHWRGILIAGFLSIILIVFILCLIYFIFRRFLNPSVPLINGERKNYATILNSRMFLFI